MKRRVALREEIIREMAAEVLELYPRVADQAALDYAEYLVDKAWDVTRDAQVQSRTRRA